MKALILAGGFATRLRPLSCARPKTLFPIVNKPLLQWIFERLAQDGVDEAILAVNALTQFYIRQQKPLEMRLKSQVLHRPTKKTPWNRRTSKESRETHRPRRTIHRFKRRHIRRHRLQETAWKLTKEITRLSTMALCSVEDPCSFGVVEIHGDNIKRFVEKPAKGQAPSNLINAGAYVFSPEIFDYIPRGQSSLD